MSAYVPGPQGMVVPPHAPALGTTLCPGLPAGIAFESGASGQNQTLGNTCEAVSCCPKFEGGIGNRLAYWEPGSYGLMNLATYFPSAIIQSPPIAPSGGLRLWLSN